MHVGARFALSLVTFAMVLLAAPCAAREDEAAKDASTRDGSRKHSLRGDVLSVRVEQAVVDYRSESWDSGTDASSLTWASSIPSLGVDARLWEGLSVGAAFLYTGSVSIWGGGAAGSVDGRTTSRAFGIGPRVSYRFPVEQALFIVPRAGYRFVWSEYTSSIGEEFLDLGGTATPSYELSSRAQSHWLTAAAMLELDVKPLLFFAVGPELAYRFGISSENSENGTGLVGIQENSDLFAVSLLVAVGGRI